MPTQTIDTSSSHTILVAMNRLVALLQKDERIAVGLVVGRNIIEAVDAAIGDAHEAIGDKPDA